MARCNKLETPSSWWVGCQPLRWTLQQSWRRRRSQDQWSQSVTHELVSLELKPGLVRMLCSPWGKLIALLSLRIWRHDQFPNFAELIYDLSMHSCRPYFRGLTKWIIDDHLHQEWASEESGLHRLLASKVLANFSRTPTARPKVNVHCFYTRRYYSLLYFSNHLQKPGRARKPDSNMQKLKSLLTLIFQAFTSRRGQSPKNITTCNCMQEAGVAKKTRSIRKPLTQADSDILNSDDCFQWVSNQSQCIELYIILP